MRVLRFICSVKHLAISLSLTPVAVDIAGASNVSQSNFPELPYSQINTAMTHASRLFGLDHSLGNTFSPIEISRTCGRH